MALTTTAGAQLAACVRGGGVALFPADTVYGLACDPADDAAVERLYAAKGRPRGKPSALMAFDVEEALALVPDLDTRTTAAVRALLPGPIGVLVGDGRGGTVGLRVPDLAWASGRGLVVLQSSANRSGEADPATLGAVPDEIRAGCDLVLDGGELPGTPSTVVDLRELGHGGTWSVVREGALTCAEVAARLDRRATVAPDPAGTVSGVSELPNDFFTRPLADVDPEVAEAVGLELRRQQQTLEMIASENFVPEAILEAQGSVLTNKYAEGYPGKRYYGGCEHVDVIEQLAIDRAKELFGAEHANVQPHSGAQANAAVYHALLQPGDTIMGLALPHGGHLSHGMKLNLSGRLYDIAAYEVDRESSLIDMDEVARIARESEPQLIIAGWSAYPRQLDFEAFRAIADEVGALLMVDMAHFAGLVAAGEHPNPVPHADVVTSTVHKTLGGARGGLILSTEEHAKKINSAVFPGQQGGPLEHVVAGKAVAFKIAMSEAFRERQRRTIAGARAVAEALVGAGSGVNVLTGGTDVHLVLVDLRESELDGQASEDRLHQIGITVNRNAVPFDPRPPMVTSGLRVGTSALATRGLQEDDFREVGDIIAAALQPDFDARRDELAGRVATLTERYPLYEHLGAPAAAAV